MAQEIATSKQTSLALPESGEQRRRRLSRWMALNEHSPLPEQMRADAEMVLAEMEKDLEPATAEDFSVQIMPCLMLCGGSGMRDEDRAEWMLAAAVTLAGIPYDLLVRGCKAARQYADHPSKIVPSIFREIDEPWKYRRSERDNLLGRMKPPRKPYPWEREREDTFDPKDRCTPEEAAAIKAQFGLDEPVDRDLHLGRDYSKLRQPSRAEVDALAAEFRAKHYPAPDYPEPGESIGEQGADVA